MRDTAVEMLCARWTTLWSHTEQIPASHFTSISHFGGRMKGNINEAFLPEMRRSASFGVICIRFWRRELNEKPNFERKFITISSNRKRRAADEFNVMFSFEIKWISLPFTLCQRFPRTSKRFPRFRRSNFIVKVAGDSTEKGGLMKGNNGVSMLTHAKRFGMPCSLLRGKGMNDVSPASEDFALFSTHSKVPPRNNVNVYCPLGCLMWRRCLRFSLIEIDSPRLLISDN